jgi:hypothetical protein
MIRKENEEGFTFQTKKERPLVRREDVKYAQVLDSERKEVRYWRK